MKRARRARWVTVSLVAGVVLLGAVLASAQTVDFEAFWIRNDGLAVENVHQDGAHFVTPAGGDKAGYGTHFLDDRPLSSLQSIDWLKDYGSDTSIPYLNIWFTDGTNYAIAAPQQVGTYEYRDSYVDISLVHVKVYEYETLDWMTPGVTTREGAGYLLNDGVRVTFGELASYGFEIRDPGTYGSWVGDGPPKNGTGLNIIYGDTLSNYVGGYKIQHLTLNGIATAVPVTFTVNPDGTGDFITIQEAIDAAYAGDTINVAAGTYDSTVEIFPIVINKSLTLLGAQANVDPRPGQGGRTGSESILNADETSSAVMRISASAVEINGFTITGGTGDMVEESGSADNLLFRYNILYDDLSSSGDEAIQIKYSDGVVMEYNYAYDILQDAFNLSGSANGVVRYNEAHDIYSENAAIYCYDETNIDIIGNLVYNVPNNDGIKLGDSGDGSTGGNVKDNVAHDAAEDGITIYASGVNVENNTIYNCDSENGALYLYCADNSTVINNRIHSNDGIGLLIRNSDNVVVTHNEIYNNDDTNDTKYPGSAGIWLRSDASNITIHYNNIAGNAEFGVKNEATTVVGATCNWWGDLSGPSGAGSGLGDAVSGAVDFEPWLLAPGPNAPCGGIPMASFAIDHAKLDFKKKPDDDKVRVQGRLELDLVSGDDVDISEEVIVTVGPLSQTITMVEKGKKGDKWEYKRPKGGEGAIKHMTIDWKNGRFDIRMDRADLTGVTNPVFISIQIGDDVGSESILMSEKKHHWDYKAKHGPKAVEIEPFAITGELKALAYPNPIRDVHTATFQVMGALADQVEEIRVQVFDLSGHLVWEDVALGSALDWHTDSLSGDYLANGIYLYRVQVRIDGNWINQDVGKIAILR